MRKAVERCMRSGRERIVRAVMVHVQRKGRAERKAGTGGV